MFKAPRSVKAWLLALLLVITSQSAALAAPVTVQLRIEGSSSTIFEGPVTTDGKVIDKGDGPHACDGTSSDPPQAPGPTMTSALDDASLAAGFGWQGKWFAFGSAGDFFVTDIAGIAGLAPNFWETVLNFQPTAVGGCQQQVRSGDDVLFALANGSERILKLSGPTTAVVGQPFVVTVVDGKNGLAVGGASVGGSVTDSSGHATLRFDSAGVKRLKAEQAGAIRSNALEVCAAQEGSPACGAFRSLPEGIGGLGKPVHDTRAPVAEISSPVNGARYRRGPRLLKGSARDDESGVSVVKLALRRHVRGRCRWWSGRRERFVGRNCRKVFFFAIGSDANWSYLLPRSLPPGRYVLDVKAFDRARNRDERFAPGRNRVVFHVVGRRASSARSSRIHSGRRVRVMVVGKSGLLAEAREVRAARTRVRVSGRRCRVAASTPLAALAARLRGSRIGYNLHDFGRCSAARANSSAQLFVDRIAADRNSGQDGWFYKVDDRAGTAGAADPAGGALRTRDRVLWFYCRFDNSANSCQRSLRVTVVDGPAVAGKDLGVRAQSFDNEGHGRPERGVTVTLGSATTVTAASGSARLTPTRAGRFLLRASKNGASLAFPVPIIVLASAR